MWAPCKFTLPAHSTRPLALTFSTSIIDQAPGGGDAIIGTYTYNVPTAGRIEVQPTADGIVAVTDLVENSVQTLQQDATQVGARVACGNAMGR